MRCLDPREETQLFNNVVIGTDSEVKTIPPMASDLPTRTYETLTTESVRSSFVPTNDTDLEE